ncbi:type II toxin-antitoxin system VapC family toxin [Mesorhizobium sp. CN5-321]|jgi:ribonuclease VapC|uniref:type II toxin-antitoxin system VapC family toxin n=1 Tax=Mesorhizobium hunchu TaxID=3157708 RepID=UPI0032B75F01
MFVDASALTAMIAGESDASELVARLDQAQTLLTSPIAVWEATVALARLSGKSITDVREDVERFLELAEIRTLPVPPEIAAIALDAFDRFGKGRHPAKLNMGDCFAYACARHFGEPLLYKGADFPLTDIEAG